MLSLEMWILTSHISSSNSAISWWKHIGCLEVQFKYCFILPLCARALMYPSSPFFVSITVKDVKALLPQVNFRVPNMRFLKDKLQVRTEHVSPPASPTPLSTSSPGCSDLPTAQWCIALTHLLPVYTGGGGQERSVIPQLLTALQNSDVRRSEECEYQFWSLHTSTITQPWRSTQILYFHNSRCITMEEYSISLALRMFRYHSNRVILKIVPVSANIYECYGKF